MSFGRCLRSLGKLPCPSCSTLYATQRILTTSQDHHSARSSRVSPRLWRYHQLIPVHLREPIRVHNQDRTTDMARLHSVSHYETEVRHSARPVLPVPVRQRSRARVVALRAARRLLRVHYVRWLGHSRKYLSFSHTFALAHCIL